MSYSFSVTAATKAEVGLKIVEQFAKVVRSQPNHKADENAAVKAACAFVDMLVNPAEGQEIYVSMNGSLGWNSDAPDKYVGAGISISASIRQATKA